KKKKSVKEGAQTLQIQFFSPVQPFYFHSLCSPPFYCFPLKETEAMLTIIIHKNNDLTRMPLLQPITPVSRETKNASKKYMESSV
ncbi:hypothetical protein, partial [Bacillus licheniformis]|uniref:hypothetical protein n=3 Tax=Bacillus licheniformis TaxID=1402 RepID=UPI00190931DE